MDDIEFACIRNEFINKYKNTELEDSVDLLFNALEDRCDGNYNQLIVKEVLIEQKQFANNYSEPIPSKKNWLKMIDEVDKKLLKR